jgi:hypothetical protein
MSHGCLPDGGYASCPRRLRRRRHGKIPDFEETPMNEETFNLSIRKFLKMVGINSQREIERAVQAALDARQISGSESFPAKVTLEVPGLSIRATFDGDIKLQ